MPNPKRTFLPLAIATLLASACGRAEHANLAPDVRREIQAGGAAAAAWSDSARAGFALTDQGVIALGYMERLRVGLGSPFRLIESALVDPRLDTEARRRTAWALLARTVKGESYQIDPIVLDRAGMAGISSWPGLGVHHLELIDDAIRSASDPRSGELAVRLAYEQAAMEHIVSPSAPAHAARVAALLRDRELARRDALRLLQSAEAVNGDPLGAVMRWRDERWFELEAPALMPLDVRVESDALALAPRVADELRTLNARLRDITEIRPAAPDVNASLLTRDVATRLAEISDSLNAPAQAPILIGARTYRVPLMTAPWLAQDERRRRSAFAVSNDEEQLVATHALLTRGSPHDAAPSMSMLWSAVAMRAYAQESVWFPGFGGPATLELANEFGIRAIRFDSDVPSAWRPYYRAMLQTALRDMRRVLPSLDLRGLTVVFGATPEGSATLAMHDPRGRRLILPPGSAAGTIAHEIAHDIDWQIALRHYHVRGNYATDRATRTGAGLASLVRELTPVAALDATSGAPAHERRPAENFARAIDWFVTTTLAAQGRSNGHLSSIQDDMLTGYGTVRPPDITGRAGDALIAILDDMLPPDPEARAFFVAAYGSQRDRTALDLVRAIAEAAAPRTRIAGDDEDRDVAAFRAIDAARRDAFAQLERGRTSDAELEERRREMIVESVAARARGAAIRVAQRLEGDAAALWIKRQLYGGLWPAEDLDDELETMLRGLLKAAAIAAGLDVASDAVDVGAPDHLVQLDLVADGQTVLEHPLRKLTEVGTLPDR